MEKSTRKKTSSWYRQLSTWKIAISATLNDSKLLKKAISCGYSKKDLESALTWHKEILELDEIKEVAYGRKYAATDNCIQAKNNLHKVYMRHLSLARVVFKKDRGTLEKLSANGKRKSALVDWLSDVRKFYNIALSETEIKNIFKNKGIAPEELEKGIELTNEVELLSQTQKQLTDEAVIATYNRDEKISILRNWYTEFNATTKIVGKEFAFDFNSESKKKNAIQD
ncbi:hypothetical protein [Chondrinema litorale]|uniref:hypothetical protein n=1 Tax=Chondrinema litorale TaxID=2994555 RepID=UPI002542AF30|nr:hypothetical protein [Chondrinema litorale]UZR95346.1 hypothetical protein OQ292_05875 [Chondrinema litorale]